MRTQGQFLELKATTTTTPVVAMVVIWAPCTSMDPLSPINRQQRMPKPPDLREPALHQPFCPAGYTGDPFSACRVADPEEACHPSPCGLNTKCHVANNQAICTCLPGYRGSPLSGCRHECESDYDCGSQQSCRDFKCTSPCNDCGVSADCETVAAHRAVCKCPRCPSYKPACVYNACINPCTNVCGVNADCNLRDLCEPNPCGANAKCTPGHDRTGAERPVCTCPSGYIGNALVACRNGDALVNCYESRSEAASTRYYRYKRNGQNDPEAPKASEAGEIAEANNEAKVEVSPDASKEVKDDTPTSS
ncbi:hypothetical protein MSG28_005781 [Choristoneura fumiferana]|uniref:Uncharacterized protein n=1 Tax=Choristoneura fumiferana TaxID=7141 RepID=A0ACC0L053_CHOFU|nr:hypothetical protein MSG28_005781 [Choristoneura fumiferana]